MEHHLAIEKRIQQLQEKSNPATYVPSPLVKQKVDLYLLTKSHPVSQSTVVQSPLRIQPRNPFNL